MCRFHKHLKQKDHYSKRKQPHAVKRIHQRTCLTFDQVRRQITSKMARLVGKARYDRDLYEIQDINGKFVYVVWERKHWCIKTVLTRNMVEKGVGRTLQLTTSLSQPFEQVA